MLKHFSMEDPNPVSTPMDPNVVLQENEESGGDSRASQIYATAIGKRLYAAHAMRPDILYAVVTLAQFTKNPSPVDWTPVKQIYRYLKGTIEFVLTYGGRDQSWLLESPNMLMLMGAPTPTENQLVDMYEPSLESCYMELKKANNDSFIDRRSGICHRRM